MSTRTLPASRRERADLFRKHYGRERDLGSILALLAEELDSLKAEVADLKKKPALAPAAPKAPAVKKKG